MTFVEDLKKTTEKMTGWQRPDATQLAELPRAGKAGVFRFKDDGMTPNHPRWPLLILWRLRRALESPIAIACLRLLTFPPRAPRPLRAEPRL